MVQESPELRAVVQRWINAVQRKDAATIRNLISGSPFVRYIGSDEAEVWSGTGVRTAYPHHAAELPEFKVDPDLVEAFEEGTVGWATLIGTASFEGGSEPQFRMTWVCVLEAGAWRIIQTHISVPVANLRLIGQELTSGLEALLASLDQDPGEGDHGTVTVMFTDLEGSTELSEVLNDTAWADLIRRHHRAVASAVEEEGGRVVKTLGDGTMATFDSARGALRAALAIQQHAARAESSPPLRVRIGIHTGDVVHAGGDFLGHAVNKAARIASVAEGGQTMLSQVTRELVGFSDEFQYGDPCACKLKGLEGPHILIPLVG
jgi:class 3 adenylate cyclase